MKKASLVSSAIWMTGLLFAGNNTYYENMGKALQGFSECEHVADFQNLANQFHRIAQVEKEQWLPRYYEVQCYLLMTFVRGESAEMRDRYLEQARPVLDEILEMAPSDPEVLTLKAWWYTCSLVVDPPARSMSLQPQIAQSLATALSIEPGHPRAMFMRISNDMGTAAFFGNDLAPYCKQASELLASWDDYTPASPIHPSWGKEEVEGIVARCGQ